MSPNHTHPKWWQVYLTFPLLIALFTLDSRLEISTRGHQAVQIGIILIVYGLIHLWIKANAAALSEMDLEHYEGSVRVIKMAPHRSITTKNIHTASSMLKLPESEIKGTLSNTIEMETIDVEAFPVDVLPQEIDKE